MSDATPLRDERVAVLSDGKVFIVEPGRTPVTHVSRFAKEAEARVERNRATNEWKEGADSWNPQTAMMPGLARFQQAGQPMRVPRFTNIAGGPNNTLCYSMDVFGAGGLFTYDLTAKTEMRIMHQNAFNPLGLAANPSDGMLAYGLAYDNATVHLKVREQTRVHQRQLTDGDTRDEAPCWHNQGDTTYLYFHCTAVGRNNAGFAIGRGPGHICRIPLSGGDVEVVVDQEQFDFLQPRLDEAGNLYAIRRDYQSQAQQSPMSFTAFLMDVILFPYRLLRMVFFFCNFLSLMFVGKPLTSESLTLSPTAQAAQRVLWGRALQTQKSIAKSGQQRRMRLVPSNWELVRINPDGPPESLLQHVLAFDVSPSGTIVYSDGSGVYQYRDGQETQLADICNVEQIAILSSERTAT